MNIYIDVDILICSCYYGKLIDKYKKFEDQWDYLMSNLQMIYSPDKIIPICSGYSFRHFLDSSYKSNRPDNVDLKEFKKDIISSYGIYQDSLLEADDIIGLLARDTDVVVTTDKDIRMLKNCIDFNLSNNTITNLGSLKYKQIINGDKADGVKPIMSDKASDDYLIEYFNGEWSMDTCLIMMIQLGYVNCDALMRRYFLIKILEADMIKPSLISELYNQVLLGYQDFHLSIRVLDSALTIMQDYVKKLYGGDNV